MKNEVAAPMVIPDIDFDTSFVTDETRNRAFLKTLRSKTKRIVGHLPSIAGASTPVAKTGDGHNGYYFVEYDNKIVVLIQYQASKIKLLNNLRVITQVALWKDDDFAIPSDFSSRLFFDIVLKDNGALLSDKHQTRYGMKFWQRRLIEALDKSKQVIYWDSSVGEATEVDSIVQLQVLFRLSWSSEKASAKLRWVIME